MRRIEPEPSALERNEEEHMGSDGKSGISRREFVKTGSVAAVGVPMAVSLAGRAFGSQASNEIRCAVVGTGGGPKRPHQEHLQRPGAGRGDL
jgi:hypothetical protein